MLHTQSARNLAQIPDLGAQVDMCKTLETNQPLPAPPNMHVGCDSSHHHAPPPRGSPLQFLFQPRNRDSSAIGGPAQEAPYRAVPRLVCPPARSRRHIANHRPHRQNGPPKLHPPPQQFGAGHAPSALASQVLGPLPTWGAATTLNCLLTLAVPHSGHSACSSPRINCSNWQLHFPHTYS